jgi:hypothetical protein
LNSDHTHFIIVREQPIGTCSTKMTHDKTMKIDMNEKQLEKLADSATSATNKFRDRFEAFLHQETLQQATEEQKSVGKNTMYMFLFMFIDFHVVNRWQYSSLVQPIDHIHIR